MGLDGSADPGSVGAPRERDSGARARLQLYEPAFRVDATGRFERAAKGSPG